MKKHNIIIRITAVIICLLAVSATYSQNWYQTAGERIDTLRKGDFTLVITDTLDNPFTDSVYIHLKKHEFPWGNTIDFFDNSALSKWKQAVLLKYYNYGVVEAFKWPYIESTQGILNYTNVDFVYNWAAKVGWDVRAHTLIWGGHTGWQMPSWTLSMEGGELYDACETHIRREVSRYKGTIKEYDVINEPYHETWLADNAGDSINWNAFIWADEEDPDARLFVNEFNVIIWSDRIPFTNKVQTMLNHGAPIDGIGVQGHMESNINWNDVKTKLDAVGELGLPVKVTEFDMKIDEYGISEQSMANYYAIMMRTCFSHPAVEGFIWWGYCDPTYRDGSGIFNEDRSPKIAADTVYRLIHEEWSTSIKTLPETDGTVRFHGFYGDYEVYVKSGDDYVIIPVSCLRADDGQEIGISLKDAVPRAPRLLKIDHNLDGTVVNLYFDKEMQDPSSHISDFQVVLKSAEAIDSVKLDNEDPRIVRLYLKNNIQYDKHHSFVYIPGSWKSTDGASLEATGPETIISHIPGCVSAQTTVTGDAIEIFLSEPVSDPSGSLENWQVWMNGTFTEPSGISYKQGFDSVLVLSLASPVSPPDIVRLYYTRGTLTGASGYLMDNIVHKIVENMVPTGIKEISNEHASVYPNPFTGQTTIEYTLGKSGYLSLEVADLSGRTIKTLVYGIRPAGKNQVTLDGSDLESGIYLCRIIAGDYHKTMRMIIAR